MRPQAIARLVMRIDAVPSVPAAPSMPLLPLLHRSPPTVPETIAATPSAAALRPVISSLSRWSLSGWVLARGGGEEAIAGGSLLGGSQAGARLLYRLNADPTTPLSVSARLIAPLKRRGVEAAVGVEWQPLANVPLRLLAERRERVRGDGRSAFALTVHGGVSDVPAVAGLRLDAYGQAGVVGARGRDLFADGSLTLVRPLRSEQPRGLAFGAGVWGQAQPGAARLDMGPRLTTRVGGAALDARLSLDWRFRVAGEAAPRSGPALTIATDF